MKQLDNTRFDDPFLGNSIGAFARALSDRMDNAITKATGLSCSACHAIVQIGCEPNLTIDRLSKMLDLKHSSVVRLVDRLEGQELVRRARGKTEDMRQVSLELTDVGEDYFARILESRRGVLNPVVSGLKNEEKKTLMQLIHKLEPAVMISGRDLQLI